jgi:uncharacterized protein (TIGR04168 family)
MATLRLAVVGDVHGDWDSRRDGAAIATLGVDACLWVGDFGEERTDMVSSLVADGGSDGNGNGNHATPARIVLLGNHDAWYSLTTKGRRRAIERAAAEAAGLPTDKKNHRPQQRERRRAIEGEAAVAAELAEQAAASAEEDEDPAELGPGAWAQLQALGEAHAGYRHWGALGSLVSVVGARPFSKGGTSIADCERFYRSFYGVRTLEQSASRILSAARGEGVAEGTAPARSLVLLAHNGPAGLGSEAHDPCGVDWLKNGTAGDHGDPDLRWALDALHEGWEEVGGGEQQQKQERLLRRHVALVVHGHMHHRLRAGGHRRMVHVDAERRTVILNAATVPRVRWCDGGGSSSSGSGSEGEGSEGEGGKAATLRHFLVVELRGVEDQVDGFASAEVERAEDVWVRVEEEEGKEEGDDGGALPRATVAERREVLRTARSAGEDGEGGVLKLAWDAASGHWTQHVWRSGKAADGPVAAAAAAAAAAPT